MTPPQSHDRALYNSRIIDSFIRLVRLRYPHVNVPELLQYAGMKGYEVADQAHWFTQDQVNRFHERLVQLTGNHHIAREAGRYAASPEALGAMRQYILGMVGASNAFGILNKTTTNFTRSSRYESRRLAANRVEITVTPLDEVVEQPFQCENRIGFFEAVVLVFNPNRGSRIEHPECIFKGGTSCRYLISWEKSATDILRRARDAAALLLSVMNVILVMLGTWSILGATVFGSIALVLLLALLAEKCEKREMQGSLEQTRSANEELLRQISTNYNNALLTNEIGRTLGTYTDMKEILEAVVAACQNRLEYDRGMILLADPAHTRLLLQASYGYGKRELACLERMRFRIDRPAVRGVFTRSFREQRPFLINNLADEEENLPRRSLAFARLLDIRSFICCPIICDGASLGVLTVDNMRSKRPLIESDMTLLMGVASMIGISLRNSQLIEASLRQFKSLLHVLAASIDARDSLTAGHSEKVTEYSLAICEELDLDAEYCDMIRVAALLHDYGKIGVPDDILKKTSRLSPDEYENVKIHAGMTEEILAKVNFEGIYSQVPQIAGAHHEKIDGSGYPKGLRGEEIPLGARIIAVADYFESITSKRHYRNPLPIPEAIKVLRSEAGKHLDRQLVEVMIELYLRDHPEHRQPGTSTASETEG